MRVQILEQRDDETPLPREPVERLFRGARLVVRIGDVEASFVVRQYRSFLRQNRIQPVSSLEGVVIGEMPHNLDCRPSILGSLMKRCFTRLGKERYKRLWSIAPSA
jgi:hypothetical protein